MDTPTADAAREGPRQEYERRLARRAEDHARAESLFSTVGTLRGLTFVLFLALGVAALSLGSVSGLWTLLPTVIFLALVVWHDSVDRRRERARRAMAHYQRGIARLDDAWAGTGEGGERFSDAGHPYSADLDLFGEGSLFELLSTARTSPGEEALASWLTAPPPVATARARQVAITELRSRLDLRETLDRLGHEIRAGMESAHLAEWAGRPELLPLSRLRWLLPTIAIATALAAIAAIFLGFSPWLFVLFAAAAVATRGALEARMREVLGAVNRPGRELLLLALVIERLEEESFESPFLVDLQEVLRADGQRASVRIHALRRLVEMANARENQFFVPIDLLTLWTPQVTVAIETWRLAFGPSLPAWLEAVGELEAILCLATYAYENPEDPFPELLDGSEGAQLHGEALGHPLLPRDRCVRNDVELSRDRPLLMVSGSNMSGKTTFLRTIGVNAVLGLCGAPVRARTLRLSPLVLGGTLRIQDSLREGASRFYAELKRLKELVDLAEKDTEGSLLFLLDEVLSGTNSHDRGIGARFLLEGMLSRGAIGLCTTHDLALTAIARDLPGAVNIHFQDELLEGQLHFDYRVHPGVVERSNALALMEAVGLPGVAPLDAEKPQ